MSQLLALEWNATEARVAAATKHGSRVVIDQAFAIPLHPAETAGGQSEADIGAQIAKEITARGLGRSEAIVAVSRANIELRQLQVPAVPDDEMPEIVRMQAMREFNELNENWLLDFIPIDAEGEGPRTVLATAVAPGLIGQIEKVCHPSGLKMRRLVLRSCGAASLLARAETARVGQVRLLVDLLADEADLTVMVDSRAVFLRTTRLSGDPPQSQALLAEIRLTAAAVQNQLGGRKVTLIVLCGGGDAHAALARQIEEELGTSVKLFDPFEGLELGRGLRDALPAHPGRFAPLLGVLLAELEQTGQAIDFLHPRRRAAPPSKRKKWAAVAAAAAVLVVAYYVYGYVDYNQLSTEVQRLTAQAPTLKAKSEQAAQVQLAAEKIKKWTDGEVVWLEHLRDLSKEFPKSQVAALGQLTFSPAPGGGEMRLKGWAQNAEAIAAMEEGLRSPTHRVVGRDSHEDRVVRPYSQRFDTSVFVGRESKP